MIKNRAAAFVFRLCAVLICVTGILINLEVFTGNFLWVSLLYYTLQSNIAVVIMFGVLTVKTTAELKKKGTVGSASYFPRTCGAVLLGILLTLLVFWILLAPDMGRNYILSYQNFGVHLINPLLMLADYIMFTDFGKMKKFDPFLYTLFPISYLIQATILGFAGVNYNLLSDGKVVHFPYFFIDYYETKAMVALYIIGISIFYVGLAYLFGYLQKRFINRNRRTNN